MTFEELSNLNFHFVSHLSMEDEHRTTYASEDEHLGFSISQPYKNGHPVGKSKKYYRIQSKWYDTWDEFLEALKDFHIPFNVIKGGE